MRLVEMFYSINFCYNQFKCRANTAFNVYVCQ